MKSINFKNLLYNLVMALFIGVFLAPLTGLDQYTLAGGIVTLGITYSLFTKSGRYNMKGLLFMGLQRHLWSNQIEGEIYKKNPHLNHCKKVTDANIITSPNGRARIVHIQQSGGSGNVVKNRKNLPLPIRIREDDDVIYKLDDYSNDASLIAFTSEKELSPEYRESVLGEDQDSINEQVGEDMIINWLSSPVYDAYGATSLPASNILSSTGSNGVNNNPTGDANRKNTTITDLQRMRTYFLTIDRWFEGKMYAMLTPQQEAEIFPANDLVTQTAMQMVTEEERRNGVMYKAQGWKLMTRSSVVNVANDGTIKVPGEALVATDDFASLFWYEGAVEYAPGGTYPFFKAKDPLYQGDVFSFLTFSGGRARRKDYKGVALLKQDKTA